MRKQKVQGEKIGEMKDPGRRWNHIPACVHEKLGIRGWAFYSDRVSSHDFIGFGRPDTLADNRIFARRGRQPSRLRQAFFSRTAVKSGLLTLIVSAYCSGSQCLRFNLN